MRLTLKLLPIILFMTCDEPSKCPQYDMIFPNLCFTNAPFPISETLNGTEITIGLKWDAPKGNLLGLNFDFDDTTCGVAGVVLGQRCGIFNIKNNDDNYIEVEFVLFLENQFLLSENLETHLNMSIQFDQESMLYPGCISFDNNYAFLLRIEDLAYYADPADGLFKQVYASVTESNREKNRYVWQPE